MAAPSAQSNVRKTHSIKNQSIIWYPEDVGPHFITFQFKSYSRAEPSAPPTEKLESTIGLPLPSSGLEENQNINYSEAELGLTGSIVRNLIPGGGNGISAQNGTDADIKPLGANRLPISTSAIKQTGQAIGLTALELGPDQIENAVAATYGVTKNPHLARILQSVGLREHNFSWKFVPKNEKESIALRQIIGEFRYHSLPEVNNVVLNYPSECYVTLHGSEDGFLYFFKPCVISNLRVNYAPDNIPVFFAGKGAPASVTMSVTLQETTALNRNDIANYDPNFTSKLSTGVE